MPTLGIIDALQRHTLHLQVREASFCTHLLHYCIALFFSIRGRFYRKNKGLVPVSHKNIMNPAVGKEQTAKNSAKNVATENLV